MASLAQYLPTDLLSPATTPTSAAIGQMTGRVPGPVAGTSTPPAEAYGAGGAAAGGSDPLGALKSLNKSLSDQTLLDEADNATRLQVEQQRAALSESSKQQALAIGEQSRAAAAAGRQRQLGLLSSVAGVVQKGQKAMALSDSQNPMDHLQLWLLQHSDPEYTRAGNTGRLQYLSTAAQAIGIQDSLIQDGYKDQISHIQDVTALKDAQLSDTETLAHVKAQVGQARIDSYVNGMKSRAGLLTAQGQMQDSILANMDTDATKAALAKAAAAPNKSVNISGIDITATALQDRVDALDVRAYNEGVYRLNKEKQALADTDLAQVTAAQAEAAKNGYAMINGVQVSPAQLAARQQDIVSGQAGLSSNQLSIMTNARQMDIWNQQHTLGTFNLEELNKIRLNGGVNPESGQHFDLGMLNTAITSLETAKQQDTAMQVGAAAVGNPMQSSKDMSDYIDSIQAPPGSQLANTLQKQKLILQAASGTVDATQRDSLASFGDILSGIRDNADKAVAAQAKAMSHGDKNLEEAYGYQLRGQMIPDGTLSDALIAQVTATKPVNQWLDPKLSGVFTKAYQNALAVSGQVTSDGSMPADLATRKAAAAASAMNEVRAAASSGVTDQVMSAQAMDPTSPINRAGIKPMRILSIIHSADEVYGDKYLAQSGLSDADKAAIRAGTKQDSGYAAAQAGGLIMELNKVKPGLGDAYVEYWSSKSRSDMVDGFVAGQERSAAGQGLQALSGASLVLPTLGADMDTYAQVLQSGQDALHQKQFAQEHANYVSFGADPSAKQVFLLQSTPGLTDNQRQDAYQTLIAPILDEVKAQNMSTAQGSTYIESRLRNLQPDTPEGKSLLKAVLAGRNTALDAGDNLTKLLPVMNQFTPSWMPFKGDPAGAILDRVDAHYGWWQDLQKNKGQ